jgi:hypothetical protein
VTRTEVLRLIAALGWLFAAAMLAAERRLIRRLRQVAAISPDTATPLSPKSPIARLRLTRLRHAGAVIEAGSERYYLDAVGFTNYRRSRRRRALTAIGIVITLFLIFWWLQ